MLSFYAWHVSISHSAGVIASVYCGCCSFQTLTHLQSVGLSQNRLTYLSIPTIIENLCFDSVMHLDLSFNNLREAGCIAIAHYFRHGNSLRYMDLSNCNLNCTDVQEMCRSWVCEKNHLEELYLSGNCIASAGASGKYDFVRLHLTLLSLDFFSF